MWKKQKIFIKNKNIAIIFINFSFLSFLFHFPFYTIKTYIFLRTIFHVTEIKFNS